MPGRPPTEGPSRHVSSQSQGFGMIRLLQWLFAGHVHKWEQVGNVSTWSKLDGQEVVAKGPRFVCRCEKCGVFTKFDL